MIRAVSFNTDIQEVICSSTFQFVNILDYGFILSDSQSLVYNSLYLEVTFFGFYRNWWILFITCQRFIAVTFPLHAKLILRNKVFWVSTITLCFTSFFFMVLLLMFERANYLKLIIFKMFYNYDEDFLIIATFIRNTLPIFGIFDFSKLISVILKLKSINSSTNQENNKKKLPKLSFVWVSFFLFVKFRVSLYP